MAHQHALKIFSSTLTSILVIMSAVLWGGATAQSDDCTNVMISLSPCLNYVSGNTSTASPACCTQLGTVARSQPQCLCQVINGGASSLGLNVNKTQALALPKACNIQTPPPSQCKAVSPSASTPNTGGGPSGNGSSDANSTRLTLSLLLFLLLTASYVSTFNII